MKTAIYIENGLTQFVLTPETEIDKKVLDEIQSTNLKTYRGEFYGCRGGWTRWSPSFGVSYMGKPYSDRSLIFVIEKAAPGVAPPSEVTHAPCMNPKCNICNPVYSAEPVDGRCTWRTRCVLDNRHTGSHETETEPSLRNPAGKRIIHD